MRRFFPLLWVLLWTSMGSACQESPPKTSPLDELAALLEQQGPYFKEFEAFHWDYKSKGKSGSLLIDVNRVEVFENNLLNRIDIFLRNAVSVRARNSTQRAVWTLKANEGYYLQDGSFRFRKGVILENGQDFNLEADSLDWQHPQSRFFVHPGFKLIYTEQDSNLVFFTQGDSLLANATLDQWVFY